MLCHPRHFCPRPPPYFCLRLLASGLEGQHRVCFLLSLCRGCSPSFPLRKLPQERPQSGKGRSDGGGSPSWELQATEEVATALGSFRWAPTAEREAAGPPSLAPGQGSPRPCCCRFLRVCPSSRLKHNSRSKRAPFYSVRLGGLWPARGCVATPTDLSPPPKTASTLMASLPVPRLRHVPSVLCRRLMMLVLVQSASERPFARPAAHSFVRTGRVRVPPAWSCGRGAGRGQGTRPTATERGSPQSRRSRRGPQFRSGEPTESAPGSAFLQKPPFHPKGNSWSLFRVSLSNGTGHELSLVSPRAVLSRREVLAPDIVTRRFLRCRGLSWSTPWWMPPASPPGPPALRIQAGIPGSPGIHL